MALTDYSPHAKPTNSRPAKNSQTYTDPVFGTKIVRVSDNNDTPAGGFRTTYSYWPAFNCNSTRIIVMDGSGFMHVCTWDAAAMTASAWTQLASGICYPEGATWSINNPDEFYGTRGGKELIKYNVQTGVTTVIKDFTAFGLDDTGFAVQMSKSRNSDRYFSFHYKNSGGTILYAMVYDQQTDTTYQMDVASVVTTSFDECRLDRDGRYLVVITGQEMYVWEFAAQAASQSAVIAYNATEHAGGHYELGTGTLVHIDLWGGVNGNNGNLTIKHILTSPHSWSTVFNSTKQGAGVDWNTDHHYSVIGPNDSWIMITARNTGLNNYSLPFRDEIFMVKNDGTGSVLRLAHHRASNTSYEHDCFANLSPDGRFFAYTSDWDNDSNRTDIYVGVVPATAFESSNAAPTVDAGTDQIIRLPNTATLDGSASDDGLPTGSVLTHSWSKLSGPGSVSFTDINSLTPTVTFGTSGTYVLRLTASDGVLNSTDDVTITVQPANIPPTANAGPDQTIFLPNNATLSGSASDDGLNQAITTTWSKASGPGTVTFGNVNLLQTTATFSVAGTYTLRLSVYDGQYTTTNDIIIKVNPVNTAPTVDAGVDQSITLPTNTVTLAATVSDDGEIQSPTQIQWSVLSKPTGSSVSFGTPTLTTTTATFSTSGTYTLRISASDGQYTTIDDVIITVNPANQPPSVNAGPNQTIALPTNQVTLNATVTDDGLPANGSLSIQWALLSGPASVTFGSANAATTTVTFSIAGTYTLRITASDSNLTAHDDVVVIVNPENTAPIVNAGPDVTITLPNVATLQGSASDDGFPNGSTITTTWSLVSGPGSATFGNIHSRITTVALSAPGNYVLRLSATDGALTNTDDVFVTVNSQVSNAAPSVNAGAPQTIQLPINQATLNGVITDDGLPVGNVLAISWMKISGPGNVTFSSVNNATTTATFSQAGTYILRLTASDGQLTSTDDVTITVNDVNTPPDQPNALIYYKRPLGSGANVFRAFVANVPGNIIAQVVIYKARFDGMSEDDKTAIQSVTLQDCIDSPFTS